MIAKWIIVGWLCLGVLLTIGMVGKERKPTTPGVAVMSVLITVVLIVTIITQWKE